ncbi:MAG: oxidoreductase [Desulfotomaculales bacterium]
MNHFIKLFEPVQIGAMQLKNRIVKPPMVTNYATDDGAVTERLKAYHAARARGGVGLIIVEAAYVHPGGRGFSRELGIYADDLIPGLRTLADAVHAHGAKIAIQLYHGGRQTSSKVTGSPIVAPSPIPWAEDQEVPRELTVEGIRALVDAFGEAARRAKEAGFNAVEVHGAHGYLINEFLSPLSNRRTDAYGGTLENRMRFPLEVVAKVREKVGPDFPVIYRLSAVEFVPGGLTMEETAVFAQRLVEAGVNAIHVSAGIYASSAMIIPPMAVPRGCHVQYAAAIREATGARVPVIAVGRIKDPAMAERILQEGKADLVAMGRALLADPDLPRKAAEGRPDDIRKCIACNQGCIDRLFKDLDITCLCNALCGHEAEYDFPAPAAEKKTVLVVGGGPAGLEAARVAALRGHRVILYEAGEALGGQLRLAGKPPHKEDMQDLESFLTTQVAKLGVVVELGRGADAGTVKAVKPNVIVVATGAIPAMPAIPGIEMNHVVPAWDVLDDKVAVGQKVLIIGGGLVGCETAEFLADRGKDVTVVEMMPDVATDVGPLTRAPLLERLDRKKVRLLTGARVQTIEADGVLVEREGRVEKLGDIDNVVIAVGATPNLEFVRSLGETGGTAFYTVGDCAKPRRIIDAIHEAFRVASQI